MKKFIIFTLVLILGFWLGLIVRGIFLGVQFVLFKTYVLDKELRESKLGGRTPQETWNLYLDALEKEDINLALQYVAPESRESERIYLEKLQKLGILRRKFKNYSRELYKIKKLPIDPDIKEEEGDKVYKVKYISEKELDLLLNPQDKETLEAIEEYWEDKPEGKEIIYPYVIFKYNPYTKKWLIK